MTINVRTFRQQKWANVGAGQTLDFGLILFECIPLVRPILSELTYLLFIRCDLSFEINNDVSF